MSTSIRVEEIKQPAPETEWRRQAVGLVLHGSGVTVPHSYYPEALSDYMAQTNVRTFVALEESGLVVATAGLELPSGHRRDERTQSRAQLTNVAVSEGAQGASLVRSVFGAVESAAYQERIARLWTVAVPSEAMVFLLRRLRWKQAESDLVFEMGLPHSLSGGASWGTARSPESQE